MGLRAYTYRALTIKYYDNHYILKVHLYKTRNSISGCSRAASYKIHSERSHPHSSEFDAWTLPNIALGQKIDILTITFLFIYKVRNVGGPLLWEALGRGLLGLCLKMALQLSDFKDRR